MESSHDSSIAQRSESMQASNGQQAYHSAYKQLPVNESQTRVFVLHSHLSKAAPVECSLEVMKLDLESNRTYTALSYVWGDASITEDIIVNGVSFPVTSNLASALRQIQKSFGEVLLWADAISINQRDILERNQQVLLMKSIYSKAERVICWLGPDENGGSQALKTFGTLFRNAIHYPDNFEWVQRMPELLTASRTFTTDGGIKFQSSDKLEELWLLLKRSFWQRMWIVQELVLPMNLRFLCGEEFTDLPEANLFNNVVSKLSKLLNRRPSFVPLNMRSRLGECMARLRLLAEFRFRHIHQGHQVNRSWEGVSGFINARILLEFHKTSDPRDHVYGLLGLIDLDIVPNYGEDMTVANVYLEVARHCLRKVDAPVDILSLAGTKHICNGKDCLPHLDSPSWVPDWRFPNPATVRLHRYPKSHAFPSNDRLQMQVIDHKWLRGSGVVWDTVSRTEYKTGWDLTEWDLAQKIDIEKRDNLVYPSGILRLQAMVFLWVGGYDGSRASMCDLQLDSELFRSYETIFFANIVRPLRNVHGQQEIPKLLRLMLGQNQLKSVPMGHRESYVRRSRQLRHGMRCFHTDKGYIGFGPLATKTGDLICVLEGHKAPVVLYRQVSHYIFVGDCDVVGIMNGEVLEAVKRNEIEITEIEIR